MNDQPKICHLPPASCHRRNHRKQGGFTLLQLLVAVGILVILIGLIAPAVFKAHKSAIKTRMAMDLQLIGTALDAYKSDFGDYPRFDDDNVDTGLNASSARGARILCRAIFGLGPANPVPPTPDYTSAYDGADGPGFRVRQGGQGKVYGPYVQTDKLQIWHDPTKPVQAADATTMIADQNGNPILYYPAKPGMAVITGANDQFHIFVKAVSPPGIPAATPDRPLYNAYDNEALFPTSAGAPFDMNVILGDTNADTWINGTETPTTTAPYLLWTAGADGQFGLDAKGKTDDVTNFDIPPNLAK